MKYKALANGNANITRCLCYEMEKANFMGCPMGRMRVAEQVRRRIYLQGNAIRTLTR
tara:strand:+ start:789 stop:959 length:171 start_codon:yes stop_codon:yes gene_type:complete